MKRWFSWYMVILLAASILAPAAAFASKKAQDSGRGFSIVSLQPDAAEALRAQGKTFKYPFPNVANRGKKFNPGGETVGVIDTAAEQNVLVLFADFTDAPPGGPANRLDMSYYDEMLFGDTYFPAEYVGIPDAPADRTLKNYYREVSYGKVNVTTKNMPSAMNWLNVGHPYSYYSQPDGIHDNGFGPYPQNAQGLVIDTVKAADAQVDFRNYAVNGEIPNLFVVFAGTGAEWSGTTELIWSHSWDLSEGTGLDGYMTDDGVKINNYAMMPEVGGDLTGFLGAVTGPYPPTVGVFAHEYGHVLGLPDQYDYGYESEGTGMYSLMAGGSWNRYPNNPLFSGNSPAHMDAWSKYRLGFVTPVEITSLTDVTLRPAEQYPDVYKMVVPNSGGKEYFLFENRQQVGFDQGFGRRGAGVHGLAIYHVDDVVMTRNYWRPNEAENWKEWRSASAKKVWTGERHYGISLIQADDAWDLEHGIYWMGYEGDLFPGINGITRFGNNTFPNSSSYYFWAGSDPKFGYSGITAENIQETGLNVSATLSFTR